MTLALLSAGSDKDMQYEDTNKIERVQRKVKTVTSVQCRIPAA